VIEVVGKLAACGAVAGVGVLAFAAGWLKGHVEGAEAAAQQINLLRRHDQCVGEDACEWVLNEPNSGGQRSVASIPAFRYYTPYVGTPILEKLTTVEVAGPYRLCPPSAARANRECQPYFPEFHFPDIR
jgi:hypothetical protein